MDAKRSAFIIDDNSRICEIVNGKNVSFDDGYAYEISEDGSTICRIDGQSFVDGEFTRHLSREALEEAICRPAKFAAG